jgi:hypothetical protein
MYMRDDGWSCSWGEEPKISPYDLEAAQLTLIRYILDTDSDPNLFSYEIVRVKNSIQAILDKDTDCSCSVLYSNCDKHKEMLKQYRYDRPRNRQMRLASSQHKQTANV